MAEPRRIAVVTTTRADYGLLQWTLQRLRDDPAVELQLVVAGSHLSPGFGHTIDAIRADGFEVAAEVDLVLDADSNWAAATSAGLAAIGMASTLRSLRPDLLLLLGDRFEVLATAMTGFLARVPVAHLHGGEITMGALDDGLRHAVTKLSSLHLVSTVEHGRRVAQLGEPADRIRVVGAPGLEGLARLRPDGPEQLERRLGRCLSRPLVLLTYHAATAVDEDPVAVIEATLAALRSIEGASIVATGSNADPGGRVIMDRLHAAKLEFGGRLSVHESLGSVGYLSMLQASDVVLGNSSSGVIEAPSAGTPTVNIGKRQDGRPRAASVIDCGLLAEDIAAALRRALEPSFAAIATNCANPYAEAGLEVSKRIAELLVTADLEALRRAKPFVDMPPPAAKGGT